MTKKERIQESWGYLWGKFEVKSMDRNGWVAPSDWIGGKVNYQKDINWADVELEFVGMPCYLLRPKSLHGIETNNGWTKIESEKDLPAEDGNYIFWAGTDKHLENQYQYHTSRSEDFFVWFSHWRPIVKNPKPLY